MKARLYWILLIIQVVSSQRTHSDIGSIPTTDISKLEKLGGDESNIENEGGRTYALSKTLGEHYRFNVNQKGRFQGVQDPEEESMQKKYWWVYTICFAVILASVVILI